MFVARVEIGCFPQNHIFPDSGGAGCRKCALASCDAFSASLCTGERCRCCKGPTCLRRAGNRSVKACMFQSRAERRSCAVRGVNSAMPSARLCFLLHQGVRRKVTEMRELRENTVNLLQSHVHENHTAFSRCALRASRLDWLVVCFHGSETFASRARAFCSLLRLHSGKSDGAVSDASGK